LAWAADSAVLAPPGMSSSSSWCSREIILVWSSPRERRRSTRNSQHRELLVIDHRPQAGHPSPDQGDRVRVGGVGLASLTGREHAGPRGQLRRHIHDLLPAGEEPVGDMPTDTGAALDRPGALRPPGREPEHGGSAVAVGGEAAAVQHGFVAGPSPRPSPTAPGPTSRS
jgi:hypothetical protein